MSQPNQYLTMNILKAIKKLFVKKDDHETYYPPIEYSVVSPRTIEEIAQELSAKYGDDFNKYFYTPEIADTLKREPEIKANYGGSWNRKHPFNFPGTFFTGEGDTCGTGSPEAPENVMEDRDGYEYIYRQPRNYSELIQVTNAAASETCGCYACDGNKYWTYESCKKWWANKEDMINQLNDPEVDKSNGGRIHLYIDYLNTSAELDLRRYCFFLLNGYYPTQDNLDLPTLS
jgi:hypothetical protein